MICLSFYLSRYLSIQKTYSFMLICFLPSLWSFSQFTLFSGLVISDHYQTIFSLEEMTNFINLNIPRVLSGQNCKQPPQRGSTTLYILLISLLNYQSAMLAASEVWWDNKINFFFLVFFFFWFFQTGVSLYSRGWPGD